MHQALTDYGVASQLLTEDETINQQLLLVVPSHLAKGLEFDAVIVATFDTPFFDTKIDRKLLYVALTRAMHELYLIGPTKKNVSFRKLKRVAIPCDSFFYDAECMARLFLSWWQTIKFAL